MSSEASLTTISICQLIMTVAGLAAVGVLIYAVFAFKRLVRSKADEAMARVQPIVDQAKAIAEQARQTAETVSEKVDAIATRAESTANEVSSKVEEVSQKVEEAISPQIVAAAGLIGAVVKCLEIYRDALKIKQMTAKAEASGGDVAEGEP